MLTLAGMSRVVQADIRRLALLCGSGRETARTALHRLAGEGWIRHARPAAGRHAAAWALTPPASVSTGGFGGGRSQAAPPRRAADDRDYWLELLRRRLELGRHDVFCGRGGLGFAAGNLYARIHERPLDARLIPAVAAEPLGRLEAHGLASSSWSRRRLSPAPGVRLDVAADRLGVCGVLADRERTYAVEREMWDWWQQELAWMQQTRPTRRRRPQTGQLDLDGSTIRYGPHPRRPDGRADYRAARAMLETRGPRSNDVPRTSTRAA
jgi:hypothetical protein